MSAASFGLTVAFSVAVVWLTALALPVVALGAGRVATKALPAPSTAAHRPWSAQETPVGGEAASELEAQEGLPEVGLSLA